MHSRQNRLAQYVLKTGWEILMTPVTYRVVAFLKRAERRLVRPQHQLQPFPAPPMTSAFSIATWNIHKGFSQFNRSMMVHELRDRLRALNADIVFLQEVQGLHLGTPRGTRTGQKNHNTNFLPPMSGTTTPMGKTWCMTMATTAMRSCRAFPSCMNTIRTSHICVSNGAGCCIA
jgi:hypothetical protein